MYAGTEARHFGRELEVFERRQVAAKEELEQSRANALAEVRDPESAWHYASPTNLLEMIAEHLADESQLAQLSKMLVARDYADIGIFIEKLAVEYTADQCPV